MFLHDFGNNYDVMGAKLAQRGVFHNLELAPTARGTGTGGPAMSDLTTYVAAVTPNSVAAGLLIHTIAAQPDVSRTVQLRIVDGSSNVKGCELAVRGWDWFGNYLEELRTTFTTGSQTITTVGAFFKFDSITSRLLGASTTTGVTIGAGPGPALQIPTLGALTDRRLAKVVDATAETGTSQITLRNKHSQTIWTPDSAPNGTRRYFITVQPSIGAPGVGV